MLRGIAGDVRNNNSEVPFGFIWSQKLASSFSGESLISRSDSLNPGRCFIFLLLHLGHTATYLKTPPQMSSIHALKDNPLYPQSTQFNILFSGKGYAFILFSNSVIIFATITVPTKILNITRAIEITD